jgi:hypothetical protein
VGARRFLRRLYARAAYLTWRLYVAGVYRLRATNPTASEAFVLDLILLALGFGSFALLAVYVMACERV